MSQQDKNTRRYQATRKVTLVGAAVNIVLAVAQILGGLFAQSQALIADGFHTLSDLVTDFVVLIAAKMASKDADEDHPYGHERIETIATVILGLALAAVAVGIVTLTGETVPTLYRNGHRCFRQLHPWTVFC